MWTGAPAARGRPGRSDGGDGARGAERPTRSGAAAGGADPGSRSELLLAGRSPLLHAPARCRSAVPPTPALPAGCARVLPVPGQRLRHLRSERRLGAESQPDLDPGDRMSRRSGAARLPSARSSRAALTASRSGIMLDEKTLGEPVWRTAEKAGGDLPTPRT